VTFPSGSEPSDASKHPREKGGDFPDSLWGDTPLSGARAPISSPKVTTGDLVALLREGRIEEFNTLRPLGRIDLTGISLANLNLSRVNLEDAILTRVDLSGAVLENALFNRAVLDRADLSGAALTNAQFGPNTKLRYANLSEVRAQSAIFEQADLTRADLTHGNFTGANFNSAVLSDATLSAGDFSRGLFVEAYMLGAMVSESIFKAANLKGAVLTQAKGDNPNFEGASLIGADATRALFTNQGVSFTGAYVKNFSHDGFGQLQKRVGEILSLAIFDQEPPPDLFKEVVRPVDPTLLVDGIPGSDRVLYEAALQDLDDMIGLEGVKAWGRKFANVMRNNAVRGKKGLPLLDYSLHFVFTGEPGTGKTTVARIVSRLLRGLGYLEKGHLVETNRSGLVGEYVGATAPKTEKCIEQAMGGTLFIDEAYALVGQKGATDYGPEAIAILLIHMENKRGQFVVIAAGYEDDMEHFVGSNPGLPSRFKKFIHFDRYSTEQMGEIVLRDAERKKLRFSQEAFAKLHVVCELLPHVQGDKFANARSCRNLFEEIGEELSDRVAGKDETDAFLNTVEASDVIIPAEVDLKDLRWKLPGSDDEVGWQSIPLLPPYAVLTTASKEFLEQAGVKAKGEKARKKSPHKELPE
jgi:stage V sporulation protein K